MTDSNSYITLDNLTWAELLVYENERDGLEVGGQRNESITLTDLLDLAESHPDTDLQQNFAQGQNRVPQKCNRDDVDF